MLEETLKEKYLNTPSEKLKKKEARDKIRQGHKKNYMDKYREEYKQKTRRVNITLSLEEYSAVKSASKDAQKKVSTFVKDCVVQQTSKVYILPNNTTTENLILQLRAIGNNVNQLTRHIHRSGVIQRSDLTQLQNQVRQVENLVHSKFSNPDDLFGLLDEQVSKSPDLIERLEEFILNHKSK